MPSYPVPFTGFTDAVDSFTKAYGVASERKIRLTDILSREKIKMLQMEQKKLDDARLGKSRDITDQLHQEQTKRVQMEVGDIPASPVVQSQIDSRLTLQKSREMQMDKWARQQAADALQSQGIKGITPDEILSAFKSSNIIMDAKSLNNLRPLYAKAADIYKKQSKVEDFSSLPDIMAKLAPKMGFKTWNPQEHLGGHWWNKQPQPMPTYAPGVTEKAESTISQTPVQGVTPPEAQGQEGTTEEIEGGEESATPTTETPAQATDPLEGRIIKNSLGHKAVRKDGKWVPIQ